MSELTNTFTDIADAIREKTGKSELMTPSNMANEVRSISGGGGETSDSTPIGTIHPFAGSSIPEGFLACDGSAVSRTTYKDLFDVIGTTWGAGDGSTTFNVPDLREVAPVGIGTSTRSEGSHDAFTLGEFKDDQMQSHTHSYKAAANSSGQVGVGSYPIGNGSGAHYTFSTNGINSGRNGDVTRGKRIGVNYIIKYKMISTPINTDLSELMNIEVTQAETLIGKFGNDNLYRKVYTLTNVPVVYGHGTTIDASLNVAYVKNLVRLYGSGKMDYGPILPLNGSNVQVAIHGSNTGLNVSFAVSGGSYTINNGVLIVEYTKN